MQDNRVLAEALFSIGGEDALPSYRFLQVDGAAAAADPAATLQARLLVPPNFVEDGDFQYPVFVKVYGGPASQAVFNRFPTLGLEFYLASARGMVVAEVDNRGTGARMSLGCPPRPRPTVVRWHGCTVTVWLSGATVARLVDH